LSGITNFPVFWFYCTPKPNGEFNTKKPLKSDPVSVKVSFARWLPMPADTGVFTHQYSSRRIYVMFGKPPAKIVEPVVRILCQQLMLPIGFLPHQVTV
jgi:hypothetical protein